MKIDTNLTLPCNGSGYESQLKEFCILNKFRSTNINYNSFPNGNHCLWLVIEWFKQKKYPSGEFVKYPDGNIVKERIVIYHSVKVFPSTYTLKQAKETMAWDALQTIYGPCLTGDNQEKQTTSETTEQAVLEKVVSEMFNSNMFKTTYGSDGSTEAPQMFTLDADKSE